jgi:hypothetical protein
MDRMDSQKEMSPEPFEGPILSCSDWTEQLATGDSSTAGGIARYGSERFSSTKDNKVLKFRVALTPSLSMLQPFPLADGISLRLNSSSGNLEGYVSGTLMVDVNPDKDVSNAVLTGNARFSNQQLFKASSLCLTNFFNTTEIVIHVRVALFVDGVV